MPMSSFSRVLRDGSFSLNIKNFQTIDDPVAAKRATNRIKALAAIVACGAIATACAPTKNMRALGFGMGGHNSSSSDAYPYNPIYGGQGGQHAPQAPRSHAQHNDPIPTLNMGAPKATPAVVAHASTKSYKVGAPYEVKGKWYAPAHQPDYVEEGVASWYGEEFHGRETANGETFDVGLMTAAHPTLALPSMVKVENLDNGKSITVRVNDRGPFVEGRIIDLSKAAAEKLGMMKTGKANVRVSFVGLAPITPPEASGVYIAKAAPTDRVQTAALDPVPAAPAQRAVAGNLTPGAYAIQAGAFSKLDNAKRLSTQLASAGTVQVLPALVNGVQLYKVMVGQFDSRYDAERTLEKVQDLGVPNARVISAS